MVKKIGKATRDFIFNRDGNQCLRCNSKETLTIDHVIPLVLGGSNLRTNMQTLCWQCNHDKGENLVDYRWIEHLHPINFYIHVEGINQNIEVEKPLPIVVFKDKSIITHKSKKRPSLVREYLDRQAEKKVERDSEHELYLQHQTPEQFKLAKQHGWRISKMLTAPEPNFHYE